MDDIYYFIHSTPAPHDDTVSVFFCLSFRLFFLPVSSVLVALRVSELGLRYRFSRLLSFNSFFLRSFKLDSIRFQRINTLSFLASKFELSNVFWVQFRRSGWHCRHLRKEMIVERIFLKTFISFFFYPFLKSLSSISA